MKIGSTTVEALQAVGTGSYKMSVQNFYSNLGSLSNTSKFSQYLATYRSNNYIELESMYQTSWLAKRVVDIIAEDMTRGGIEITGDIEPEKIEILTKEYNKHRKQVEQLLKWARLFGGAIAILQIAGQSISDELDWERVERIVPKGSFRGLLVFDRWVAYPNIDFGYIQSSTYEPSSYYVAASAMMDFAKAKGEGANFTGYVPDSSQITGQISGSRCLRAIGDQLPWRRAVAYLFWGASVLEAPYDDILGYEEVLVNIRRLVNMAWLRGLGIDGYREILAAGGQAYEALQIHMSELAKYQNIGGITLTDAADTLTTQNYTFSGLMDAFNIQANQIAGAFGIPLVRLLGISPAGMNATGNSDFRSYYDSILVEQECSLQPILTRLFDVLQCHLFGRKYDIQIKFKSLWQMTDGERSDIVTKTTQSIIGLHDAGIIDRATALKELKQSSASTNFGTNITAEMIDEAEQEIPQPQGETNDYNQGGNW